MTVQATDAQSSTHTFTVPFSVSSYQVDLSPTSWSYSDDEDIALEGSISDLSNDPVSTRVQATLLRKTWVRTDAKDHAGDYVGEWDIHEEAVDEVSTSSDARGDFVVSFAVPDTNGEYIVRVQAQDDKHRTAQDEHHFWVWRDASQPAQIKASTSNKIITLYPDSDVYQPGDTAQILFPHNEWEVLRAYATIER